MTAETASTNTSVPDSPPTRREHPPGTFTGCPTFIRAHCRTASHGGGSGYSEAGFHLGYHVRDLEPSDLESAEWFDLVTAELFPLVRAEDDAGLIAWLVRRYPVVMALVPTRRRASFVAGFYRGVAKGGAM